MYDGIHHAFSGVKFVIVSPLEDIMAKYSSAFIGYQTRQEALTLLTRNNCWKLFFDNFCT